MRRVELSRLRYDGLYTGLHRVIEEGRDAAE